MIYTKYFFSNRCTRTVVRVFGHMEKSIKHLYWIIHVQVSRTKNAFIYCYDFQEFDNINYVQKQCTELLSTQSQFFTYNSHKWK